MSMHFVSCGCCGGLSPVAGAICVHCDAPVRERRFARVARALGRAVIAGGALVTLMACYGMVARPGMYSAECGGDADGDGVCARQDCDDAKPEVFPGATDPDLDGIDQNCDGVDGWRDPAVVAEPAPPPQTEPSPPTAPPPTDPAPPASPP